MSSMQRIDLSGAPVIDAHCHGFTVERLLAGEAQGWQDRITVMGMCFGSAQTLDRNLAERISQMTGQTIFAMLGRRWLSEFLGCSLEEVAHVRRAALEADSHGYVARLMAAEQIVGLVVDEGYPQPRIDPADMEVLAGVPIHRVVRIEPLIEQARLLTNHVSDLEAAFRALLEEAAADPRCVAYKSIIAYRTGLDIGEPTKAEVAASYQRWREAGWREGRDISKALRDHLLHVTFELAARYDRPVHIHSGAGDPDVILSHARPANLGPLIKRYSHQPIVLIHSGYPWLEEATYLASVYPLVYMEISLFMPWATLDVDRGLNLILGAVPASKIMHGSDEASEPEIIWLAAKIARAALERVLTQAVERDYVTRTEAEQIGRAILADNVLRLHGRTEK